jgi:hypothetical protein
MGGHARDAGRHQHGGREPKHHSNPIWLAS